MSKPYWPSLLGTGVLAGVLGGVLLGLWANDNISSGVVAVIGVVLAAVAGVLLLAGAVGLGVDASGLRSALIDLADD